MSYTVFQYSISLKRYIQQMQIFHTVLIFLTECTYVIPEPSNFPKNSNKPLIFHTVYYFSLLRKPAFFI